MKATPKNAAVLAVFIAAVVAATSAIAADGNKQDADPNRPSKPSVYPYDTNKKGSDGTVKRGIPDPFSICDTDPPCPNACIENTLRHTCEEKQR